MKSVTVLRAAAFRALRPRLFDSVVTAEMIEAVKKRYQFRQFPSVEELTERPASFGFGKIKRRSAWIIIEQLSVSYVGIQTTSVAASTRTSTDDADFFLDQLISWVSKKYRLDTSSAFAPAYQSMLEVGFDAPISDKFEELRFVGQKVTNYVRDYGELDCPEFELEGFSMHFQPMPGLLPSPLPFSVQRRVGAPYAENKFFSQAPLKTRDHQVVLRNLEKLLISS